MNEAQDHVFHQISRPTKSKVQFPIKGFFLKGFTVVLKKCFLSKKLFSKKKLFLPRNNLDIPLKFFSQNQ